MKKGTLLRPGAIAIMLENDEFSLLMPKDDGSSLTEKDKLLVAIFARIHKDEKWCAEMVDNFNRRFH